MEGNKKIIGIISMMIFAFSFVVVVIFIINLRTFSKTQELEKAKTVASLIKDGLTAHMVNGTIKKREFFLNIAKESSGASKIWIFRTPKVEKLFGKGFANERVRDDIDKKVIETGKIQKIFHNGLENNRLRITIPYVATVDSQPNCLKCHTNAKEGDVLGGISMVFNLDESRNQAMETILKIIAVTLFFAIVFIYITNKFLKPYTNALVHIKNILQKASNGDYSSRINIKECHQEVTEVAKWLNTLLDKLEKMIGSIEKNISLFVSDRRQHFHDPLEKAQFVIDDMAMIYKFKRTIEEDKTKEIIYKRLIRLFKEQLHINDLSFYEVDIANDKRILIYDDTPDKFCAEADIKTSQRCRAYRTNSIVSSDDFPDICQACKTTKEYLCISYPICEKITLVLNIKPNNKEELHENKKAIGYIKNYFESAKPVLQSKILTEVLQKSNMIDGLTGLYNRKYLDNFMDNEAKEYDSFAIAMIDIDYFKKVNDTYGHNIGDTVLKSLANVFKKSIGKNDIAFRFGGEEFIIFMPDCSKAKDTIIKLKDNFENTKYEVDGNSFNKTLSAGISYYKTDSDQIWHVIKNADIALYEAKNSGRNKIVEFKDIKDKDNGDNF